MISKPYYPANRVSFDLEGDSARVKPYAPVQEHIPFVSKGKLQDLELEQLSPPSN